MRTTPGTVRERPIECHAVEPFHVTPAIIIELDVEAKAPRIYMRAMSQGEERRLLDWVDSQPELYDLVARALDLAGEARAA